jgi:hypothetical protein
LVNLPHPVVIQGQLKPPLIVVSWSQERCVDSSKDTSSCFLHLKSDKWI